MDKAISVLKDDHKITAIIYIRIVFSIEFKPPIVISYNMPDNRKLKVLVTTNDHFTAIRYGSSKTISRYN